MDLKNMFTEDNKVRLDVANVEGGLHIALSDIKGVSIENLNLIIFLKNSQISVGMTPRNFQFYMYQSCEYQKLAAAAFIKKNFS